MVVENVGWRLRRNNELQQLYVEPWILLEMKMTRIMWVGHLQRVIKDRKTKQNIVLWRTSKDLVSVVRGKGQKGWVVVK